MTSSSFGHYPSPPVSQTNKNAHTILCNAHAASSSFLHIFNVTQSNEIFRVAKAFLEGVEGKLNPAEDTT